MAQPIVRIPSLEVFHQMMGIAPPSHPSVTFVNFEEVMHQPQYSGVRMSSGFYAIMLQEVEVGIPYGRNHYDCQDGTLVFIGPEQILTSPKEKEGSGWMVCFYPDLIRKYDLGRTIDQYRFFTYDVTEALHMDEQEREQVSKCARMIEAELSGDPHPPDQDVIVHNITEILNHSQRFFERQFASRTLHHQDVLTQFEALLKSHFETARLREHGQPTVQDLAAQVHLSANYLSDLLREETGKNAKEHLTDFVIDRAKGLLLGSDRNVSEIAYDLGFNYPHYFSRMFKARTGFTPKEFRLQN